MALGITAGPSGKAERRTGLTCRKENVASDEDCELNRPERSELGDDKKDEFVVREERLLGLLSSLRVSSANGSRGDEEGGVIMP